MIFLFRRWVKNLTLCGHRLGGRHTITLSKGMIGLSALIAAGCVGIDSLTDARPQFTPASVIAERFVFIADVPTPVDEGIDLTVARCDAAAALTAVTASMETADKKSDWLDAEAKGACVPQTW